nr:MAG TPA: hypothetical protein [Caudoviricetes sp.]
MVKKSHDKNSFSPLLIECGSLYYSYIIAYFFQFVK